MKIANLVQLVFGFVQAAVKDHVKREVKPAEDGAQLPPIRVIGDPKDIYLA